VRRFLGALGIAGALAALVLGGVRTWERLGDARAHLSEAEADRAAAVHEGLPVEVFERWRAQLEERDRWWLELPKGDEVGLTTRDAVYRTFAVYWFLPALPASSKDDATDVFRLETLP
jgi:hypothetical protein